MKWGYNISMNKIIYENELGESIEFSSKPPYKLLQDPNGLGGLDVNINTEKTPFQHGSSYLNSNTDSRYIEFDILIQDENNIPFRRREISKIINPCLDLGTLKYITKDENIKEIKCKVSKAPKFLNSKDHPANRFQVCQFTLFCPQPFWEDNTYTKHEMCAFLNKFKFPMKFPNSMGGEGKKIKIINDGDTETPVKIKFIGASVNPTIKNLTTGELIKIKKELKQGDILTIDTDEENKKVEINGINAFNYLSFDTELWNLKIGENEITYETDSGAKDAKVLIEYKNRYVGI